MPDDPQKIRHASYLLPELGGEVVRDLLDELAKKDEEIILLRESLRLANRNAAADTRLMFHAALTCRSGRLNLLAMRSAIIPLVQIARRFCDRVEAGEVRSVRTYAEFKEALDAPGAKQVLEYLDRAQLRS